MFVQAATANVGRPIAPLRIETCIKVVHADNLVHPDRETEIFLKQYLEIKT
jgi:hypothetical protein